MNIYCDEMLSEYIKNIKSTILSKEEEGNLFDAYHKGDMKARDQIFNKNLLLVVKIAMKYQNFHLTTLSIMDLIQEGNIGLLCAIEKFDEQTGYKFSTYATWWIDSYIKRAIYEKERIIRLPVYLESQIHTVFRCQNELTTKLNRFPTLEEIAQELNLSVEKVRFLLFCKNNSILSLNERAEDQPDLEYLYMIKDETFNIDEIIDSIYLKEFINSLLTRIDFSSNQKFVLTHYFGLNGTDPKTIMEIASILKISRQRVEQLRNKAILKILEYSGTEQFAIYCDRPDDAKKFLMNFRKDKEGRNGR